MYSDVDIKAQTSQVNIYTFLYIVRKYKKRLRETSALAANSASFYVSTFKLIPYCNIGPI